MTLLPYIYLYDRGKGILLMRSMAGGRGGRRRCNRVNPLARSEEHIYHAESGFHAPCLLCST